MSPTAELLVLLLTGAGLAFANTLASSGSALSLPVLLALGLGPELANGTNRVAVLAGALAAMASFVRAGRIQWPIVRPLMVVAAIGAVVGAAISEKISPTSMHLAITGALLVALTLLAIKPSRWLTDSETPPRVGPIQLLLILAISIWAGFIVLDGMTYLLMALVLSVGLDVISANAAKSALAVGAVIGGLLAARLALNPAAARWIYRLLVLIIVGEAAQLVLAGMRL